MDRRKKERETRLLAIGKHVPFSRIWNMSKPELMFVLVASLGATVRALACNAAVCCRLLHLIARTVR